MPRSYWSGAPQPCRMGSSSRALRGWHETVLKGVLVAISHCRERTAILSSNRSAVLEGVGGPGGVLRGKTSGAPHAVGAHSRVPSRPNRREERADGFLYPRDFVRERRQGAVSGWHEARRPTALEHPFPRRWSCHSSREQIPNTNVAVTSRHRSTSAFASRPLVL